MQNNPNIGDKKWKLYLMLLISLICWVVGALLSLVALGFIADVLYWIIWFFVYLDDMVKWITNPKIIVTGIISFIVSALPIPGIDFVPWNSIATILIHKFSKAGIAK